MKCTVCGSKKMFKVSVFDGDEAIRSYACADCGHVDFYVAQEIIEDYKKAERATKEIDKKAAAEKKKIDAIIAEIQKYENIVTDENQTVKAVNAAREKIVELREELVKSEQDAEEE